ncbi:hypothetical protein MYX04_05390 [Nitrospiraceae bacterium AH_259_D15_M11_P09]|nr:hypothetical protein [Nitrospiraceae bacterium AH_259_D15_M11_P09]
MVSNSLFTFRAVARNLVLIITMGALLPAAGCTRSSQETTGTRGTDIVIFIDFSQSIGRGDKALFEQAFTDRIIPSLSAGDRILIAPINDKTLTAFHTLLDETFPPKPAFDGWLDNTLKYKSALRKTDGRVGKLKERIHGQVAGIFAARSASQQTDILSSLLIAQKLFHNQPRHKVLVLMSDMIVDYPPYRFDRIAWSPTTNQKILSELDEKGLIPDLSGVCVYVSGVSARSAELATDIGQFWQEYFQRTKADMDPSRYAHVLLHWPPSESCALDEGPSDTRKVVASKKEK